MRVFIHGSEGRVPPASHTKYVAPAAHFSGKEVPRDWVDADNKPITFTIEFVNGAAEVDDALGKYLIETDQAHRTRLVVPGYFGVMA